MKSRGLSATTLLSPAQWLWLAGALVLGAVAYAQLHVGRLSATRVAPVEVSTDLLAAIGLSWTALQLRTHWRDAVQRRAWTLASAGMFAIWAAESTEWLSPLLGANLEHEWFIIPLWLGAAWGFIACGRAYAMRRAVMTALWCALAFQFLAHAASVFAETGLVDGGQLQAALALVDDTCELLAITIYIAALVLTQFSPLKTYAFGPGRLGRKLRAINRDFGFRDPLAAGAPLSSRLAEAAQDLLSGGLRAEEGTPASRDMRSLAAALRRACPAADDGPDGLIWWRRCASAGLPVVPTLASIGLGGSTFLHGTGAFDCDLFACSRQLGPRGFAARFARIAPLIYRTRDGRVLSFQDLCTEVLLEAEDGELLVRPAVDSHPEISGLARGGVTLFHIVTCLDQRGVPQVTHGVLRLLPSGEPVAVVGIDGGLMPSGDMAAAEKAHPRMTAWSQIEALAQAAHRLFPNEALIGWDIALAPGGPVLAAAGTEIDVAFLQRCGGIPLDRSPLAPLLERHLDALVASEAAARGLT